jgi:hypothetical protein
MVAVVDIVSIVTGSALPAPGRLPRCSISGLIEIRIGAADAKAAGFWPAGQTEPLTERPSAMPLATLRTMASNRLVSPMNSATKRVRGRS